MKKILLTLCIALFSVCLNVANAQREIEAPDNGDEYIDEGYPGDFDGDPIAGDRDFETESKNISIGFNLQSFLLNHSIINSINKRGYETWFNKQKDIVKKAIEAKLNKKYNHLNDGLKDVVKKIETNNVAREIGGVYSKYGGKVGAKSKIRDKDIRNIKLLDFRKAEIRSGKINSESGHLKYGSTPIKDLRTISQIDRLRATDLNHLKANEALLTKENNALLMLAEIQNAINGRTIGNHPFMNHTAQQQLNYIYSSHDDLVDLDLMQLYVNNLDRPINGVAFLYNQKVFMQTFAAANFIENYALNFNPRPPSVFSSDAIDYFKSKHGPFLAAYELGKARTNKLQELLNSISTDEMLTEIMIDNLGARNKSFLDARHKLRQEVARYFKTNNFSKISQDCINYLLNQLQDGQNFAPDVSLYKTGGKITTQNILAPNTAIRLNLNAEALKKGFKGFSNVLNILFSEGEYNSYEGYIIRNIFGINELNFDATISNDWFGNGFEFIHSDINSIDIKFEGDNDRYAEDIDIFKPCRSSFNFNQLGTTGSYEATVINVKTDVTAFWYGGEGKPTYSVGLMNMPKVYIYFTRFSGSMVTNSVEAFNKAEDDLDRFFTLYLRTNQREPNNVQIENAFLGFLNTRLALFGGLAKRQPSIGNNFIGKIYKHCLFGF